MSKRDKGGAAGAEAPLKNVRRERFALAVATGQSLSAAYREVFPRSGAWKSGNLRKAASELAAVEEVARRIAALREAAAGDDCLKRHDLLVMLSSTIREAAANHELAFHVRVVDTYAKMMGFYEPVKVEAQVGGLLSDAQRDARISRLLVTRRQDAQLVQ